MDIKVTGVDKFQDLARVLKEAGRKDLQKEMFAGLNRAVKPLTRDVKDAVGDYAPNRGGYADVVQAEFKVKTRRRATGRNPAIFLMGTAGKRDVSSLNRGRLRHPLYGNRRRWYTTSVRPGFWTVTLEAGAPRVRTELVQALNNVAAKIGRSV